MQNIFSRITWRPSRKLIVSMGVVCLILGGVYIWASQQIDAMRMNNIRNGYLASYAGCEIKRFNLAVTEPDPKYPTLTVGIDNVNKYWNRNSQEWHFTHADVAEYMMKNCPPKSDEYYEEWMRASLDIESSKKDIILEKKIRLYQLKFINKDLDVFRQ